MGDRREPGKKWGIVEPFCDIADENEATTTTSTRLRTLICYSFLFSGHVDKIGDYAIFAREFRKACLWIENGGVRPSELRFKPKQRPLGVRRALPANDPAPEVAPVLVKAEGFFDIQSEDDMVDVPRDHPARADPETLRDRKNFDVMLRHVSLAYTKLEESNKRHRLDANNLYRNDASTIAELQSQIMELKTKDAELKTNIGGLFVEKTRMETELQNKTVGYSNLVKLCMNLKRRFLEAEKKAEEAKRANERYAKERKQLRAEVEKQVERAHAAEKRLAHLRAGHRIGEKI